MFARGRLCWLLLLLGCGGSNAPAKEPAVHEAEPREEAAPEPKPAPRKERAAAARCEDGSCFSCGSSVCLSGYYCLASKAGHGCAWVPSCATRVGCACVMEALRENTSCRCEEKEGSVFVSCDGAK